MNRLEQKWGKTGLLDGHEGIDRALLANNLDECSVLLITESGKIGDSPDMDFKAMTLLSMMVRLFNAGLRVFSMELLYDDYTKWMEIHRELLRNLREGLTAEEDCIELYLEYILADERIDTFML